VGRRPPIGRTTVRARLGGIGDHRQPECRHRVGAEAVPAVPHEVEQVAALEHRPRARGARHRGDGHAAGGRRDRVAEADRVAEFVGERRGFVPAGALNEHLRRRSVARGGGARRRHEGGYGPRHVDAAGLRPGDAVSEDAGIEEPRRRLEATCGDRRGDDARQADAAVRRPVEQGARAPHEGAQPGGGGDGLAPQPYWEHDDAQRGADGRRPASPVAGTAAAGPAPTVSAAAPRSVTAVPTAVSVAGAAPVASGA